MALAAIPRFARNDIANPFYRGLEVVTSRYAGALAEPTTEEHTRRGGGWGAHCGRVEHFVVGGPPRMVFPTKADPGTLAIERATTEAKRVQHKNRSEGRPLQKQPQKKHLGDAGC